ncbi:MAG TPA: VCBS repeat-containing protein [Gemmatimonadaceae bacterium]|nr:VCBS repeat-containing protein [Gemmatimonadaceae bacterium]
MRLLAAALLAAAGCSPTRAAETAALFERLTPAQTGIAFVNELPEAPGFNILNYLYYYNGGGVAVGDVDGDGLPDLYFTSNLGPNRLYRNRGNYQFEDITERAGVAGAGGWTSGVTMADVNGDGHVDIYVSAVSYLSMEGRNILYINNGDGTFTDRTDEYGLGHVGYSTQALFFDYDRDGDLDMYLLNNSTHTERGVSSRPQREPRHPRAGDKLFRNDGNRFVDVSAEAGIHGGVEGYGLGVVASDLNMDGCPDLYVANDFQENDFLYYNNCDGTFTEALTVSMAHTSRFSMGVDAADFNNDGRPDVIVLDMLPEREEILKTSANAEGFNLFNMRLKAGYHPQYARNTLQLNRGAGRFSEIGYLAGVHATDWSWAALFADLDNDGHKDLFVTNGIYRRPNDLDYINYVGNDAVQASLARGVTREDLTLLEKMPQIPLANYAFRNNGDLTFSSVASEWGLAEPGFSNGAVYVDLNNSGSLDLVVNNINAPASIYRNRAREKNGNHFLKVQLRGSGGNTAGIGTTVTIRHNGTLQMLEQNPTRGFQSSVDPRLHFGLGTATVIDTLTVIWPDQRYQVLTNVAVDRVLTLAQSDAAGTYARSETPPSQQLFSMDAGSGGIDFRHRENVFFDFNREPLMPHLLSTEGPALAVGDVNGDGLDDVYVGGAKWQAGAMYLQQPDGTFRASVQSAFQADSISEDVNAILFDANGNGHLDLYVVSGGNEFWGDQEPLRDRLYLNDGRGTFSRVRDALPDFFENGSAVTAGDFNGDGHLDLFVGSRVVAREYGSSPRSRLLQNDGTGRFVDVTAEKAPSLSRVGMVTSAAWGDLDGDGLLELVVVGEWMPVTVFRQENGRFVDRTANAGLAGTNGWWNTVLIADLTGDGRGDLVLGNLGLNSYIRASRDEPAQLHIAEFARNGAIQQLLTFYKNGVSYPVAGRDEILRLNPQLRSRYPSYASFGAARLDDIFPAADLKAARVLNAYTFASAVAVNDGTGRFTLQPLPPEAQFFPVYAAIADDFDGDGRTDLLLAGNFHGVTPTFGWYDAGFGIVLRGRGDGRFDAIDMEHSGLVLGGQVRRVARIAGARGSRALVAARNDSTVQLVWWNRRVPQSPVASAR